MIYTIPYHQDFPATLEIFFAKQTGNNLLLLPKYLESHMKFPIKSLSYEEFFIDKNNLNNLAETLLIDKIFKKHSLAVNKKKPMREALKEALQAGLTPKKLLTFTKEEELFKKILGDLLEKLEEQKASLKSQNLFNISTKPSLYKKSLQKFDKVFGLLPNNFSLAFLKVLQLLEINFLTHGFSKSVYPTSSSHPHYLLEQIVESGYQLEEISGPSYQDEALSIGLDHLVTPGPFLYTWQEAKLYSFTQISELFSTSQASELFLIGEELSKRKETKVGIISPDIKKLKNLFHYLKNKLKESSVILTIPSSSLEEKTISFFFQIIDFISAKPSFDKIVSLARNGALKEDIDITPLLQAEKYLIKLEGLDLTELNKIKDLLEEKLKIGEEITALLEKFLSLNKIKKGDILLQDYGLLGEVFMQEPRNPLEKYLLSHLSYFINLVSLDKIPSNKREGFTKLLLEIKEASLSTDGYSFEDYKSLLKDLSKRYPITSEERFIGGEKMTIELLLPHEAKNYELAIICDLVEGLWPNLPQDHYFISAETRRSAGYEKPNLASGAARDFLAIIAKSKKTIISTVKEKLLLKENKKVESRFSLLLKIYKKLAGAELLVTQAENPPLVKNRQRKIITLQKDIKPKNFSATSLEKLMTNPYLYYLEHLLKIKYLPKNFQSKKLLPSNREFGILLHKAIHLSIFKPEMDLLSYHQIFENNFLSLLEKYYHQKKEYLYKIWQGKINYIIKYLYDYNQESYEAGLITSHSEKLLQVSLLLEDDFFITLQSTLDRLDSFPEEVRVIDYKTGQIPTNYQLAAGLKPQLPFEGLLVTLEALGNQITLDLLEKPLPQKNINLLFIRITGLASSSIIKKIPFDLKKSQEALVKIIKYFYYDGGAYQATDHYNFYLEGQLLGHLDEIEVKI